MTESPMDYELFPARTSVGPHRNESTHSLIRDIEATHHIADPLIQEAVARLEEADAYFYDREIEQDRLHLLIMKLVPKLRDYDAEDPTRYWSGDARILLKNDDPDDVIESVTTYMDELYKFARQLQEDRNGIGRQVEEICEEVDGYDT